MINGTVVGLQAQIGIILCLREIPNIEIKCVVDTGMIGFLTLPPAAIGKLGLTSVARINANLADNSNVAVQVYTATILWNGVERSGGSFSNGSSSTCWNCSTSRLSFGY